MGVSITEAITESGDPRDAETDLGRPSQVIRSDALNGA